MLKVLSIIVVLGLLAGLFGCVHYEPVPVAAPAPPPKSGYTQELEKFRAEVVAKRTYADVDKSANTLMTCDRLGFTRGSDGHRLCVLRGMDRYVDHMTPPISERYITQADQIVVQVPKPQPPVVITQPAPRDTSALVDCRIDPRPPCSLFTPMPEPWQYGGQARPPHMP